MRELSSRERGDPHCYRPEKSAEQSHEQSGAILSLEGVMSERWPLVGLSISLWYTRTQVTRTMATPKCA